MGTDVLVLDPDLSTTVFLERRLVLEGYTVESVSSLEEGVAVARADSVERARVKANKVIAAIKVEL